MREGENTVNILTYTAAVDVYLTEVETIQTGLSGSLMPSERVISDARENE